MKISWGFRYIHWRPSLNWRYNHQNTISNDQLKILAGFSTSVISLTVEENFLKWSFHNYSSSSSSFSGAVTQLSCLCFIQVQIQEFAGPFFFVDFGACQHAKFGVCHFVLESLRRQHPLEWFYLYLYTVYHSQSYTFLIYLLGSIEGDLYYRWYKDVVILSGLQSPECMEITCAPVSQLKMMLQGKKGA